MTSRFFKGVGALVLSCGCATTYGPAFSSSPSTQLDVYLYGAHAAASRVAVEVAEDAATGAEPEEAESARSSAPATASKDKPSKAAAMVEQDGGAPIASSLTPGTYKGTDWVTIDLPGFPGSEQVDDKARVVLAVVSRDARLSFTVLDTNSGSELCKVEGAVVNDLIAFESGQTCFDGILGLPMQTSLYEGEGRIVEGALEVTLGIELTLTSAEGDEIVGDLSYRFEGKLTEAATED